MKMGTRTVLFGVHALWLHPAVVAIAWIRLWGMPWDTRVWISFILHDIGYVGKNDVDGLEGETHVELGAGIMTRLFGEEWGRFCRYHLRFYARRDGVEPSQLCYADQLATVITPAGIYLRLAKATGEIYEYMQRTMSCTNGEEQKYANCGLRTRTPEEWFADVQAFLRSWVEQNVSPVASKPAEKRRLQRRRCRETSSPRRQ